MSEIELNNIIRVSLSAVPSAVAARNINEVALFTTEKPSNIVDPFLKATSPAAITKAYGTNSLTARMAQNIFAQDKNLITGKGYLVVIPYIDAVSATPATLETTDLVLGNFTGVSDGALTIKTNGKTYSVKNIDFSNCANLTDVVSVLQAAFTDVLFALDGEKIKISATKVGEASSLTFETLEGGTDLTGADYLNTEAGTAEAGANATGETTSEAIERIKGQVRFTGVLTTKIEEDTAVETTAAYCQSGDLIYMTVFYSATDITGACKTIKEASQTQTRCLCYTGGYEAAKLMLAAYTGRAFSTNFSGSNTSQTLNLKELANVSPDDGIDQNAYSAAKEQGVDLYVSYDGVAGVASFGGNSYFDEVYENMALKFAMQAALFNALRGTTTKIPQTEAGMSVLKASVSQTFIQYVNNGVIAAGKWNSSETFGDPETFKQNIENQGWYVYSTPISQQAQSEREQRIAPVIQGAAKRSGAFHEADLVIIVEA